MGEAMSSRWRAEGHQETLGDPSEHPRGLDEAGRWQSYICHHAKLRDKRGEKWGSARPRGTRRGASKAQPSGPGLL